VKCSEALLLILRNRLDPQTEEGFSKFKKYLANLGGKGELAGLYLPYPRDFILINTMFLRKSSVLEPEPVILVALHELWHAKHPRRRSEKEAERWARNMLRKLTRKGYTSRRFRRADQ